MATKGYHHEGRGERPPREDYQHTGLEQRQANEYDRVPGAQAHAIAQPQLAPLCAADKLRAGIGGGLVVGTLIAAMIVTSMPGLVSMGIALVIVLACLMVGGVAGWAASRPSF